MNDAIDVFVFVLARVGMGKAKMLRRRCLHKAALQNPPRIMLKLNMHLTGQSGVNCIFITPTCTNKHE